MWATLDWEPQTTLQDGLGRTIAWYRENKAEADARP
jgi:dTDP-D-glucose 4,6-dehydratase